VDLAKGRCGVDGLQVRLWAGEELVDQGAKGFGGAVLVQIGDDYDGMGRSFCSITGHGGQVIRGLRQAATDLGGVILSAIPGWSWRRFGLPLRSDWMSPGRR